MTGTTLLAFAGRLGTAGANEPILAGVVVFGLVGVVLTYLSFFHQQMEAGPVLKALSVAMLALAAVSYVWPMRPWA